MQWCVSSFNSPKTNAYYVPLKQIILSAYSSQAGIYDCKSQSNPDWGTRRTNIRGSYSAGSYMYTSNASGKGVDAYVIGNTHLKNWLSAHANRPISYRPLDTGIYCGNNDFTSKSVGTCKCGIDYVDGSCVDGNGHGTHWWRSLLRVQHLMGLTIPFPVVPVQLPDRHGEWPRKRTSSPCESSVTMAVDPTRMSSPASTGRGCITPIYSIYLSDNNSELYHWFLPLKGLVCCEEL